MEENQVIKEKHENHVNNGNYRPLEVENSNLKSYNLGKTAEEDEKNKVLHFKSGLDDNPEITPFKNGKKYNEASEIDCSHPLKLLDQAFGAYIKQKSEMYEIVTGCETKNRYSISLRLHGYNKLYKAFKCKEESSWCMRNCCSGESREFKMMIKYSPNGVNDKGDDYLSNRFAEFDRPYKCTCCNFNRPELNVFMSKSDTNPEHKVIGKIWEPYSCSRVLVNVNDEHREIYRFDIDRTQPGISCRAFTCGAIESVDFPIINIDNNGVGIIDGEIKRMGRTYDEAVIGSDADCYDIIFPKNATAEQKFLILATSLLIDFRYFEDTEEEESTIRRRSYYSK